MKKIICVILAVMMTSIVLSACASPGSENDTTNAWNSTTDSYYSDYNYDSYEDDYLSEAEAEEIALAQLYWWLECCFMHDYDISATRYSVGSVKGSSSSGYTVRGKYYLYDEYGNMEKARNFSVRVQSDGTVDTDDIDLFAD